MIIISWLIFSFVAGIIASNKGRSFWGFFFLAILLSPIIGIVAALVAKADEKKVEKEKIESGNRKKCPACAELVLTEAKICKHCGTEFKEETTTGTK